MRNVTKKAKKSAGLSQRCGICPLYRNGCDMKMNRVCFDSFVEGYKKGAKAAEKEIKQLNQNKKP